MESITAQVFPGVIQGEIVAPASKSVSQRVAAAALLAGGTTRILNPGRSNDELTAYGIIQQLGANLQWKKDELWIESSGKICSTGNLNCGESGLSTRLFTPIAGLSSWPLTIQGQGSLLQRPMDTFAQTLPQLGVNLRFLEKENRLPISVTGPLRPGIIEMDASSGSQFLSGLLMALSALPDGESKLIVNGLTSIPYISLTMSVMEHFGLTLPKNDGFSLFTFNHRPPKPNEGVREISVEGDWSGASFFLVAAAIGGEVSIKGLNPGSLQADRKIIEVLQAAGAAIHFEENKLSVQKNELRPFRFDATNCPDLFPPLVALAAVCSGISEIRGVKRLFYKESNRAKSLKEEFEKMGVPVDLQGDFMLIQGGKKIQSAMVKSHNDHRIAMACAVVGLLAEGPLTIQDAGAVAKSYPDFFRHLAACGVNAKFNDSLKTKVL